MVERFSEKCSDDDLVDLAAPVDMTGWHSHFLLSTATTYVSSSSSSSVLLLLLVKSTTAMVVCMCVMRMQSYICPFQRSTILYLFQCVWWFYILQIEWVSVWMCADDNNQLHIFEYCAHSATVNCTEYLHLPECNRREKNCVKRRRIVGAKDTSNQSKITHSISTNEPQMKPVKMKWKSNVNGYYCLLLYAISVDFVFEFLSNVLPCWLGSANWNIRKRRANCN